MVATVHPAKGYLNTSFYIHNTSESIISFSIKNENGEVMAGDVPVKCKKEFLHCEKESGIADSGGHLSKTENLKTPFYFTGTSRPVFAKSRSFLARFTEEAVIKSNGDPVPAFFKKHPHVEGAPVELLFEVLSVKRLSQDSPCRAIDRKFNFQLSVYRQYQNHCLDEKTFKIFSYLSGPIERGSYNRYYLVKWLNFIHNLLISSI